MHSETVLSRPSRAVRLGISAILLATAALPLAGQAPGELFPEPFVVEHYTLETAPDGERFATEPVRDTYGGSWIVSERGDGSRLILDLARRELTEVRPSEGVYWRLGFDRMGELVRRIARLDGLDVVDAERSGKRDAASVGGESEGAGRVELQVDELTGRGIESRVTKSTAPAGTSADAVRHLRVTAGEGVAGEGLVGGGRAGEGRAKAVGERAPWTEVWVDSSLRLTPAAVAALGRFERDALAADDDPSGPAARLAAVRVHTDGAVPVRTLEPLTKGAAVAAAGTIEDVVTRIERLDAFDASLVGIPEGLRRAPHPLEGMADVLEDEAERRRLMGSMPEHREGSMQEHREGSMQEHREGSMQEHREGGND
ncbi:MAG: hypothetical protein AAGE94_13320 [Acidobacteriota bacterium]